MNFDKEMSLTPEQEKIVENIVDVVLDGRFDEARASINDLKNEIPDLYIIEAFMDDIDEQLKRIIKKKQQKTANII